MVQEKTDRMKTYQHSIALVLISVTAIGAQAQSKYGNTPEDSVKCVQNLSLYQEFMKQSSVHDAYAPWKEVVNTCPASSKGLYQNGVKILTTFIEAEKDPARKARLIDSLGVIYDLRITHFGERAFVLGRKGVDLMVYDPSKCTEAFAILKESVELGGSKSEAGTLSTYYQTLNCLYGKGEATKEQMLQDYVMIMGHVDAALGSEDIKEDARDRYSKARDQVNSLFFKVAECGDIGRIVGDMVTAKPDDMDMKNRLVEGPQRQGLHRRDRVSLTCRGCASCQPEQRKCLQPGPVPGQAERHERSASVHEGGRGPVHRMQRQGEVPAQGRSGGEREQQPWSSA
jgi:hypothetical protein